MTPTKYLFLHGGPGLQSEAERRKLTPLFQALRKEALFFDEPSFHRPQGPPFDPENSCSGWIAAAEGALFKLGSRISVIGCSFGAIVAEHLYAMHPNRVGELILVSPTPDLQNTFLRMMKIAEDDFRSIGSEKSGQVALARTRTRSFYDSFCQEGLALVFQDPLLFSHYWRNREAMAEWVSILSEPKFAFDSVSQHAVYSEMSRRACVREISRADVAVTLCVGEHDPVVSHSAMIDYYGKKFPRLRPILLKGASHFLHLEKPEEWIKTIICVNQMHRSNFEYVFQY